MAHIPETLKLEGGNPKTKQNNNDKKKYSSGHTAISAQFSSGTGCAVATPGMMPCKVANFKDYW